MKQENFNTFRVITGVAASCLVLGSMITGAAHALADKFNDTNDQLRERDQKIRNLETRINHQIEANHENNRDIRKTFIEEFHRIEAHIAEVEAKIKAETE